MNLHERIAAVFADFAKFERNRHADAMARAQINYPHLIKTCAGCERSRVVCDGVCPECLQVVVGALRMVGKGRR